MVNLSAARKSYQMSRRIEIHDSKLKENRKSEFGLIYDWRRLIMCKRMSADIDITVNHVRHSLHFSTAVTVS